MLDYLPNEIKIKIIDQLDTESILNLLKVPDSHKFITVVFEPSEVDSLVRVYADVFNDCGISSSKVKMLKDLYVGSSGITIYPLVENKKISLEGISSKVYLFLTLRKSFDKVSTCYVKDDNTLSLPDLFHPSVKEIVKKGKFRIVARKVDSWYVIDAIINPSHFHIPDLKYLEIGHTELVDSSRKFNFPKLEALDIFCGTQDIIDTFNFETKNLQAFSLRCPNDTEVSLEHINFKELTEFRIQNVSNFEKLKFPKLTELVLIWYDNDVEPALIDAEFPEVDTISLTNQGSNEIEFENVKVGEKFIRFEFESTNVQQTTKGFEFLERVKFMSMSSTLRISQMSFENLTELIVNLTVPMPDVTKPMNNLEILEWRVDEDALATTLPFINTPNLTNSTINCYKDLFYFDIEKISKSSYRLYIQDYNHPNQFKKFGNGLSFFPNLKDLSLQGINFETKNNGELEIPESLYSLMLVDNFIPEKWVPKFPPNCENLNEVHLEHGFESEVEILLKDPPKNLLALTISGFHTVKTVGEFSKLQSLDLNSTPIVDISSFPELQYICKKVSYDIDSSFKSQFIPDDVLYV